MNKTERLAEFLAQSGLSEAEIATALATQKAQPRTHKFYKIYLTPEQAEFIEGWAQENEVRFELANPIEKQRKYNPRKSESPE